MKNKIGSCNAGNLSILTGMLILVPLLILPWFPEDLRYVKDFLYAAAIAFFVGILLNYGIHPSDSKKHFTVRVDVSTLTVLYAWIFSFIIGALPFVFAGKLTFVQALFESVSGWTTTGLSVMDVTQTPAIFLFHRSFMQFCGGLGFVMLMILFVQSKHAKHLYSAEGHPDQIMPNLRETVKAIFIVYVTCLIVGILAYTLSGMPFFDSLLHTMGALSTGGFSNQPDSIGAYQSASIELVTIVLMLIGATNFATLWILFRGKWKRGFCCSELHLLGWLLLLFAPFTAFVLMDTFPITITEGVRHSLFNIVSALSTTGYATTSFQEWPPFAIGVMIVMMLIGGGIGSTAGGMKLSRIYIILQVTKRKLQRDLHSDYDVNLPYYYRAQGKTWINDSILCHTTSFLCCYIMVFLLGSLLLTLSADVSFTDAMFEFSSSLGTVGLSMGFTNPITNSPTLVIEMIGMFLGRLEIFIVLTGLYSAFTMIIGKRKRIITSLSQNDTKTFWNHR